MILLRKLYRSVYRSIFRVPSRTVRYAFPAVLMSSVLLIGNVLTSQDQPRILLEVSEEQVRAGEMAYLDVKIDTRTAINAVTIIISAPREKVLIDTIEVSDSVITLWTEEPQVVEDSVVLRGGTFRRGFIGEHTIARIAFTPATTGTFTFMAKDIELVAGDGRGTVITPDASTVRSSTIYALDAQDSKTVGVVERAVYEQAIRAQLGIGDSSIGLRAISQFMSAWSNKGVTYDFDGDGTMSFRDFAILLAYSFGL